LVVPLLVIGAGVALFIAFGDFAIAVAGLALAAAVYFGVGWVGVRRQCRTLYHRVRASSRRVGRDIALATEPHCYGFAEYWDAGKRRTLYVRVSIADGELILFGGGPLSAAFDLGRIGIGQFRRLRGPVVSVVGEGLENLDLVLPWGEDLQQALANSVENGNQ
jgi:hypothetical protein